MSTDQEPTVAELESDLFFLEHFLSQAEKELGSYTKIRGWSADICQRVDDLTRFIATTTTEIAELKEWLNSC
jgi:hypothetical protein